MDGVEWGICIGSDLVRVSPTKYRIYVGRGLHDGALGHVPTSRLTAIYFYASLCSYKSMKAISCVKCVQDFAYHSY